MRFEGSSGTVDWLLGYPSRALTRLEDFFTWQYWYVVVAIVCVTSFVMGWAGKRAEGPPLRWNWMGLGVASAVVALVAFGFVFNRFGALPPGVLTATAAVSGAKGVSVGGGITYGEAWREWREWMRRNREV